MRTIGTVIGVGLLAMAAPSCAREDEGGGVAASRQAVLGGTDDIVNGVQNATVQIDFPDARARTNACVGTLVTQTRVLTAADCFRGAPPAAVRFGALAARPDFVRPVLGCVMQFEDGSGTQPCYGAPSSVETRMRFAILTIDRVYPARAGIGPSGEAVEPRPLYFGQPPAFGSFTDWVGQTVEVVGYGASGACGGPVAAVPARVLDRRSGSGG